ncbi:MAG: regulatory protein RecX [Candidatus Glassbacteria bacterium]|nr:regulatory protein RecX [Candidatus Glassbacteria bacterium]
MTASGDSRKKPGPPGSGGPDELEYQRAVRRAMDLLAVRVHSTHQLRTKLARKFPPAAVERALERIAGLALLDDLEFAREYVRQRIARSPRSPGLLVHELRSRGVQPQTAAEAVASTLAELGLTEQDLAEQAARGKLGALAGQEEETRRLKLFRFLSSRGFQAAVARRVADEMPGSP